MPSLQEWENALDLQRKVVVDSSNQLAQAVNLRPQSRSFNGSPKNAQGLPQFSVVTHFHFESPAISSTDQR